MKRLSLLIIAMVALITVSPTSANAVKGGVSAPGHPRIVALYFKGETSWPNPIQTCTGFLYSPRIVFTAAHCVHNGPKLPKKVPLKPEQLWAGLPGAKTGNAATKIKAKKIFFHKGFESYTERSASYKDDFAVIVFESDVAKVPTAKLATKDQIEQLITQAMMVSTGGYGQISAKDAANEGGPRSIYPQLAQFRLIPFDDGIKSIRERMAMWNRNFYQEDAVSFMRYKPGTAHPCNGDSGSGFFIQEKGVYTYLGVTWAAVHPLCEKGNLANEKRFQPPSGYVVAFRGVYTDMGIVNKAIQFDSKRG